MRMHLVNKLMIISYTQKNPSITVSFTFQKKNRSEKRRRKKQSRTHFSVPNTARAIFQTKTTACASLLCLHFRPMLVSRTVHSPISWCSREHFCKHFYWFSISLPTCLWLASVRTHSTRYIYDEHKPRTLVYRFVVTCNR